MPPDSVACAPTIDFQVVREECLICPEAFGVEAEAANGAENAENANRVLSAAQTVIIRA